MDHEQDKMSAEMYELICKDKFEVLTRTVESIRTILVDLDATLRDKMSDTTSRVTRLEVARDKVSISTIIASVAVLVAVAAVIVPVIM